MLYCGYTVVQCIATCPLQHPVTCILHTCLTYTLKQVFMQGNNTCHHASLLVRKTYCSRVSCKMETAVHTTLQASIHRQHIESLHLLCDSHALWSSPACAVAVLFHWLGQRSQIALSGYSISRCFEAASVCCVVMQSLLRNAPLLLARVKSLDPSLSSACDAQHDFRAYR